MKQIIKGAVSVVLAVLVVVLGFVIYGNYNQHKQDELAAQQTQEPSPTPEVTATPEPTPEGFIEPANAANVKLTACGDLVCHEGLNSEARKADGSYDYTPLMNGCFDQVNAADYAICTMETTFPEDGSISGYPTFKTPAALAESLKRIGFDLINTASNHSLDSGKAGLDSTLNVLEQNGLDHVGTYRSQEERDANNGILVKEINGISFAILSYSYGTNGIPADNFPYSVNLYFKDYMKDDMHDINYDLLKSDMAAARALDTDMIIVLSHWGYEYETKAWEYQTQLSDFFFDEGVDIIIGGHPHVPQPIELRRVTDNEGNEKNCLVAYCLGNFLSCMNDRYTDLTAALNIDIQKNLDTGETYLRHVSYTPMYMVDLNDVGVSSGWRYTLWNLHAAVQTYEGGNNMEVINETLYTDMVQAVEDIHSIMDAQFDSANGGVDVYEWAKENAKN